MISTIFFTGYNVDALLLNVRCTAPALRINTYGFAIINYYTCKKTQDVVVTGDCHSMHSGRFIGIIAVIAIIMLAAPVAACHAEVKKTGPAEVCANSEMTYAITATAVLDSKYYVKVVDYLPTGVTYISSSSGGVYDVSKNTVTWIYGPVANNNLTALTVTVRPTSALPATLKNNVKSWVSKNKPYSWVYEQKIAKEVTTTVRDCQAAVTIVGEPTVCTTCEETSYDIGFTYTGVAGYYGKVVYELPAGVSYMSSSAGSSYDGLTRTVSWEFGPMNAADTKGPYQVTINPQGGSLSLTSNAKAYLKSSAAAPWTLAASAVNQWTTDLISCVPEYPSGQIPATMIIGVLGIILCIRRNREE